MTIHRVFILREDRNASALYAFLKANREQAAKSGKPLQVEVTEEKDSRSLAQNRRYWSILQVIAETGWIHGKQFDREAWHFFFRKRFLPCLDGPDGLVIPTSTTKLSVEEFNEYMTQVEAFAAQELGVEFMEAA